MANNFWSKQLGLTDVNVGADTVVRSPWYAPPQYPQQQTVAPQGPPQQQEAQGWGNVAVAMHRAPSARLHDTCPSCGSSNYFRPEGQMNAMLQCYECGHNPRFSQTGGMGGMPSGSAGAEGATPARQIDGAGLGGVSQFNPRNIIAHI